MAGELSHWAINGRRFRAPSAESLEAAAALDDEAPEPVEFLSTNPPAGESPADLLLTFAARSTASFSKSASEAVLPENCVAKSRRSEKNAVSPICSRSM